MFLPHRNKVEMIRIDIDNCFKCFIEKLANGRELMHASYARSSSKAALMNPLSGGFIPKPGACTQIEGMARNSTFARPSRTQLEGPDVALAGGSLYATLIGRQAVTTAAIGTAWVARLKRG